jgi:hypothetical protein
MQWAASKKLHRVLRGKERAKDDSPSVVQKVSESISALRPTVLWQRLRGLGERRMAIVFSCQVMPSDTEHFHHHAGAVDKGINAGSTAMSPGDGNFLHFEFELFGQKKYLGIETPTLDLLRWKDRLNGRLLKGFEPTLRVLELQAEGDAQHQVEDAAKELAVQRLALGLGLGTQPARADGDVGALFQSIEKLGSFFDWRR